MANNNNLTFPGVYTTVIDQSFLPATQSPFQPGIIGAATKGPFDTPTVVTSLRDFVLKFGNPLTTEYNADNTAPVGNGFFLADAVAMAAPFSNSITVVRVGNQYTPLSVANGSGTVGSYTLRTSVAQSQQLNPVSPTAVYIRVQEAGKASTVNALVITAGNGTVSLDPTGDALADSYDGGATISFSHFANAANKAESVLKAYTYGTDSASVTDAAMTQFGTVAGTKNQFQFTVQSAGTQIAAGSVFKIRETNKATTSEIRVKEVVGNTVFLETAALTRVGYQALPLQDNYTSAVLYQATGTTAFLSVQATEAGEWANGANSTLGLYVQVAPGSAAGSKKFNIYWNSSLVEVFDNLSDNPVLADNLTANPNYYTHAINGVSQFIRITNVNSVGGGQLYHAASTAAPWDVSYLSQNLSLSPKSMPQGAVNAGIVTIPPNSTVNTGGQFDGGANGSNPQDSDFVGTVNPLDDTNTGLQAFTNDDVNVNILAAPMDKISIVVEQELARVAGIARALGLADVPANLTARQAVDWHNGQGVYQGRGRINNYRLAVFWNWLTITDNFSGLSKLAPPTLGALRCLGFTFTADFPWYAAAGMTRGLIPEATNIQYGKVSQDVRQAMYGNGNSVNPILRQNGQIMLWGDRTMQIAESKLVEMHAVNLVNNIVVGLGNIGRRFVFEPNDSQLLTLINLAFGQFLDGVKNQRGLEAYKLVVDSTNNTSATRNRHQVIVDLAIIPTDVAETIFINLTVNASGAQLNTVTT
jgi:hypothetical protein